MTSPHIERPHVNPAIEEIQQEEPPVETHPPVSVVVEGPVRAQILPAVVTSIRRIVLPADNSAVHIANADQRRRTIRLWCLTGSFSFADNKTACEADQGAMRSNSNTSIDVEGTCDLWAKSDTGGTAVTVSIIELDWAE